MECKIREFMDSCDCYECRARRSCREAINDKREADRETGCRVTRDYGIFRSTGFRKDAVALITDKDKPTDEQIVEAIEYLENAPVPTRNRMLWTENGIIGGETHKDILKRERVIK